MYKKHKRQTGTAGLKPFAFLYEESVGNISVFSERFQFFVVFPEKPINKRLPEFEALEAFE